MGRKRRSEKPTIRERIADATNMPKEIILNTVLISVIGNREMTLENYKSIIEYGDECIRIKTNPYVIQITGENLEIKNITQELLYITGFIKKIDYT